MTDGRTDKTNACHQNITVNLFITFSGCFLQVNTVIRSENLFSELWMTYAPSETQKISFSFVFVLSWCWLQHRMTGGAFVDQKK
jgi:hypothetical protein